MNIFYSELARFWPLLSPVEDYEAEASEFARVIEAHHRGARTVLELGSGGGHNAFHLKRRFSMTLTDLSRDMLSVSSRLNPDCEHIVGDMRQLDLGRSFDVVFAHDAIDYMTTEADLQAALATAYRHLAPGGLALFVPDQVKERYAPDTDCGGTDAADGCALRYLEWSMPVAADDSSGVTHYSFIVREADGSVRCLHEEHRFGLFSQATWRSLLQRTGFTVVVEDERTDDDREPRLIFLGRRAASE